MKPFLMAFLLLVVVSLQAQTDTIPLLAVNAGSRSVQLTWTMPSGVDSAWVARSYPDQSTPVTIATVSTGNYLDHMSRTVCGDTVRYRVTCLHSGDTSVGFAALYVADDEPTAPAEWGVVTVSSASQSLLLEWEPSPDTDIMGYMVCEGSPSMVIDTVFGRFNTHYSPAGYPVDSVYLFRLCAFDSCRQASALTEACNNMVVSTTSEPCSREVVVRWNGYINMPGGVNRYTVWAAEDGAAFVQVAEAEAGASQATILVSDAARQVEVEVHAEGVLQSVSSRSSLTFSTSERPSYFYLRKVSVSDDGTMVSVEAQTDPAYESEGYRVYRSVDQGPAYEVGSCFPTADGALRWTDPTASPANEVLTYWLGVTDGCGRNEIYTVHGSTILPQLEEQDKRMLLSWNAYEGWEGSTLYEVFRAPVSEGLWESLGMSATCQMTVESAEETGPVRYKIIASEGGDSRHQRGDTLQSVAVICSPQTQLWLPNAFTPDENANQTFRPFASYVSPQDYSFSIYNRAGLLVFTTTDTAAGWDGTARGVKQPQGAYLYKIMYRQTDGTRHEQVGTVLLIR